MKMNLLVGAAALATVSFISAGAASAGTISINFDTLQNDELVNTYYDGGSGSLGSTGGPNYGVSFTNALVLDENLNNEQLLITPPNSITFLSGGGAIMDVAAGFTTGFSFNYSAPIYGGEVDVYSGLDGTGTLLATLDLPTTANGVDNPACGGKNYCPDVPFGVTFSGTAESVNFSGTANYIVYDDITLGSSTPGVPEPATWAMMLMGFGGLGIAMRSHRRQKLAALAA